MPDPYIEFFLNAKAELVQYETVEISHPDFSQVYRFVRNHTDGLTATIEGDEEVDFEYCPLKIGQSESTDDLDYGFKIELGDVGEILPNELDLIASNNGFFTKPLLIYRSYRSDDLTATMVGPLTLEVVEFVFNKTGVAFEAKAPLLNINGTGEIYTIGRFPMLRGFI